jgi:hypothetical protein
MSAEHAPQEAALEIRYVAHRLNLSQYARRESWIVARPAQVPRTRSGVPGRVFLQAWAAWAPHTDTPADAMANRCCEPWRKRMSSLAISKYAPPISTRI